MGCTGPGDFIGEGGCTHCDGLIIKTDKVNFTHVCRLETQVKQGATYEVRYAERVIVIDGGIDIYRHWCGRNTR
jgi:hypothetical protein